MVTREDKTQKKERGEKGNSKERNTRRNDRQMLGRDTLYGQKYADTPVHMVWSRLSNEGKF